MGAGPVEQGELAYYWALAKAVKTIPENEGERIIKKIVAAVQKAPGISQHKLRQNVRYSNTKDFNEGIKVIVERQLLRFTKTTKANKTDTYCFYPLEKAPVALAPLPALMPRAEIETPTPTTTGMVTDNLPQSIVPEPPESRWPLSIPLLPHVQ